jgi:hypothetical protein
MTRRTLSASLSIIPVLAGCCLIGLAAMSTAVSAGNASAKARDGSRNYVLESGRRGRPHSRPQRIYLPIGPSYVYQDYPYYYRRGHYPRHIGGYVYFNPSERGRCYRVCGAQRRTSKLQREACGCR